MGDSVLHSVEKTFNWINNFDVLVWSYQLRIAKPDRRSIATSSRNSERSPRRPSSSTTSPSTLKRRVALGMKALEFTTVDRLRADLIQHGFDAELPLPN